MLTSNRDTVDYLIKNEPNDFYEKLYAILEHDSNTFDLNSFKNFYIVRRLPLYNTGLEKEALKIVDDEMKKNSENISRIFKTLLEDMVGHGTTEVFRNADYLFHYSHSILGKVITSPHVVTNMSHVITALRYNIDVKSYDVILEFGGGYGGMAKVCSGMGFNSTYYIYDLPQLKRIQEYHLTNICVRHKIINTEDQLEEVVEKKGKKMFIATWSISEVSSDLRERIVDVIKDFDSVFIIFQHNNPVGDKQNNYNYFYGDETFRAKFNKINKWNLEKMRFVHWDGGSYYMIGNTELNS